MTFKTYLQGSYTTESVGSFKFAPPNTRNMNGCMKLIVIVLIVKYVTEHWMGFLELWTI